MSKYISIDLESQGLLAVGGSPRAGGAKIDHAVAWVGTEAEGGPPPLTQDTARQIGEQLRDRLRAAGVANAPVVVAVGRDRVVLKELRYPAVPPHEEPSLVRFQAMKELSDSPDEVVLDYVPLTNGAPTGERRSMAVAVRKDVYAAIQKLCAAANLKLVAVTPRPYAVAAGLAQALASGNVPAPESKADAVAVLTLGPAGGEFTVVRGGEVTFTLAVPAPVVASETMLLTQIRRNLTTYAGSNPGHPVQALYVADADDGWAVRFRPALGIPVHTYDPLGDAVRDVPDDLRGRFAGAAGLLAARGGDLPINFATPRQPRAEVNPNKNRLLVGVLAAIIFLTAGAAGGWYVLDAAEKNVAELTAQRDQKKKLYEGMEPDKKRLDAVEQWRSRGVVWLDELYDMSARVKASPNGLTASLFHGKEQLPDAKTGKQKNQGKLDVRVATRDVRHVNELLAEIYGDNGAKTKYYDEVSKKPSTTPPSWDRLAQETTITAAINARPASAYDRPPPAGFTPPQRRGYPPKPASPEPKKDDSDDGPAAAPPPKEKGTTAE